MLSVSGVITTAAFPSGFTSNALGVKGLSVWRKTGTVGPRLRFFCRSRKRATEGSISVSGGMASSDLTLYPAERCKFIHLIRHGQATHNVAGEKDRSAYLREEFMDAVLTPTGWEQAMSVRQHLRGLNYRLMGGVPELVIVSPLTRTLQTASALFGGDCVTGTEALKEEEVKKPWLMVNGAGDSSVGAIPPLEGVPSIEAVEICREHLGRNPCDRRRPISYYKPLFPAIDFSGLESDEDILWKPDHRETDEEMNARSHKFLEGLLSRPETNIAVVTHSSFLVHLVGQFGGDCGVALLDSFTTGFRNCEMRSYVLVDRSGVMKNPSSTNFPGGTVAA